MIPTTIGVVLQFFVVVVFVFERDVTKLMMPSYLSFSAVLLLPFVVERFCPFFPYCEIFFGQY